MALRFWLVMTIMATALVVDCTASVAKRNLGRMATGSGLVGDHIGDEEMMMGSEESRRVLAQSQSSRYISYAVLKKDAIPCNKRGNSYYNCQDHTKVNPYRRGCSEITLCYRYTH